MNKQELIDYCNALKENKNQFINCIDVNRIINIIKQLDEPQKVIIPQFVADWIEECEEKEKTLLNSLLYTPEGVNSWVGNSDNQELFARAWIEGYEVEKEKRYLVKVKGMKRVNGCLAINKKLAIWFFGTSGNSNNYRTHHTRKELEEAGFGWIFSCEGIEIEEVTE